MTRVRIGLALAAGTLGLLGLAACGPAATDAAATGDMVSVADTTSPEGLALAALGLDPAELAGDPAAENSADNDANAAAHDDASPVPHASARTGRHPIARRIARRQNALHGEVTVKTREGTTKVVAGQRGAVQTISGRTLTVKSTDGFTQTWTLADDVRVVKNRAKADASAITSGATVGVAGARDGDRYTARLVVVTG